MRERVQPRGVGGAAEGARRDRTHADPVGHDVKLEVGQGNALAHEISRRADLRLEHSELFGQQLGRDLCAHRRLLRLVRLAHRGHDHAVAAVLDDELAELVHLGREYQIRGG